MFLWKIDTFPLFRIISCSITMIDQLPNSQKQLFTLVVRTKFKNMARGQCLLLILFLLGKLSRCSSDHEDSVSWDVKDSIKFGVADSSISVSRLHGTCFVLLQWKMKKTFPQLWRPMTCELWIWAHFKFKFHFRWILAFFICCCMSPLLFHLYLYSFIFI